MNIHLTTPSKIEFVYFTPHLVVAKHLIMGWRVRNTHDLVNCYIEVTLLNGSTLHSDNGHIDVPAFVRKQLAGPGSDVT